MSFPPTGGWNKNPDMGAADMAPISRPLHPTLRHPLTGQPLRALYVDRHGRARWPIMGAEDTPPPADPPADEPPKADPPKSDPPSDTGFPASTPLEQMTADQREAYWKHYARRNEDRLKQYGGLTPEQLTELREKAERQDALEDELASDKDKAVKEAQTNTQAAADEKYQPMLVETAFRVAIGDGKPKNEVDDFLADLNLKRFLTGDGQVDTAKVLSRVEQFAPAKGTRPKSDRSQGGDDGNHRSGSVAQVMADRAAARAAKNQTQSKS